MAVMIKLFMLLALIGVGILFIRGVSFAAEVPMVGQKAPTFKLLDSKEQLHQLSDYAGKWVVLYFYPKDDTPGCTKEACHFRDDLAQLEKLGGKVVGVSVDDTHSHAEFAKKYNLPFPLLADSTGKVAASYGALTNLGIIKFAKRYTFLIDPQGKIAKIYLNVDTSTHSQEIIEDLKALTVQMN
jgi:peroxiredoxin Q/BCP